MTLTTTPSVEGKRLTRYCGVVTGDAILGANVFKDLFASIRDVIGGRSAAYEGELKKAREIAFRELEQAALDAGPTPSSGSRWNPRASSICKSVISMRPLTRAWSRRRTRPAAAHAQTVIRTAQVGGRKGRRCRSI